MKYEEEHEAFWIGPNAVVRSTGQVDKFCGLDFCQRSLYARNLCSYHWKRWNEGKELRPIYSPGSFGATPCVFPGCDGIATSVRPDARRLCGAHVSQHFKGWELQPVGYRVNDGYNEDRTARRCKICRVEKPLDAFYDRNQNLGRKNKSTKCKDCYKQDIAYGQGKRNTKADGSDPKNYAGNPELRERIYQASIERARERARRKEEDKK